MGTATELILLFYSTMELCNQACRGSDDGNEHVSMQTIGMKTALNMKRQELGITILHRVLFPQLVPGCRQSNGANGSKQTEPNSSNNPHGPESNLLDKPERRECVHF